MAPFVGATLGALLPSLALGVLGVGVAAAAWPWMTGIPSRPLLTQPGTDWNILSRTRSSLYFATAGGAEPAYRSITSEILESGCSTVGIMLSGDSVEYPLWVLLDAPRTDLQLEWIVANELGTDRLLPGFRPCAVICNECSQDTSEIRGIPIHAVFDDFTLYLR
jgi:hypothetical protein